MLPYSFLSSDFDSRREKETKKKLDKILRILFTVCIDVDRLFLHHRVFVQLFPLKYSREVRQRLNLAVYVVRRSRQKKKKKKTSTVSIVEDRQSTILCPDWLL